MASQNDVVSLELRKRLTRVLSGDLQKLSPAKYIALGTGGQDGDGNILPPADTQTELRHKVGQYSVGAPVYPSDTTVQYSVVIPEGELTGAGLNEMALVAEDGTFYMMRSTLAKFKEENEEFEFSIDCKL